MLEKAFEIVDCHTGAEELTQIFGLLSFGPHLGEMISQLRSCNHPQCVGAPRFLLVGEASLLAERDAILALRN